MSDPKTRTDCGAMAVCRECGNLKDSMSQNYTETARLARQHVEATEHDVFISPGNIISLSDPDPEVPGHN